VRSPIPCLSRLVLPPELISLAGLSTSLPLSFEEGGITLNISITVHSEVTVELQDTGVDLVSRDTGASLHADSYDSLPMDGDLDLVARIVRFYRPGNGVRSKRTARRPKGPGWALLLLS